MPLARLFKLLKTADVMLAVDADGLTFDAPVGALTADLRAKLEARKPELIAALRGDYKAAAFARLPAIDPEQREPLAEAFDERAAICEIDGGLSRGEAYRVAFIELDRAASAIIAGELAASDIIAMENATTHRAGRGSHAGAFGGV
jgi:hypothetical protein